MLGKKALEEAFNLPRIAKVSAGTNSALYVRPDRVKEYDAGIADISQRVKHADDTGVGYTICSHTVPGVQGERDSLEAEKLATEVNDWIAEQIKDHRNKLALLLLCRCMTPNKRPRSFIDADGTGKDTILFYDQPQYDAFWSAVQEVDVPIYLHPSAPQGVLYDMLYKDRKYLVGPPLSFANDVSLHLMGLVTNGVFDRFPKVQVIVGHLGEHIPFDLWRINHWLEDIEKPLGLNQICKKTIHEYFKQNIWITTSGRFSSATLQYCMHQLGADRILFSVDYPYESYEDAGQWLDATGINLQDKVNAARTRGSSSDFISTRTLTLQFAPKERGRQRPRVSTTMVHGQTVQFSVRRGTFAHAYSMFNSEYISSRPHHSSVPVAFGSVSIGITY